jgi:transposase
MATVHFIAMDTHCHSTNICVKTRANRPGRQWQVATTIPAIRAVIEQIKRPRFLTFEEGPLADWLWRNLKDLNDEAMVCDPRKNALVAKDGDKDDPIDANKLCDLRIGGYLRAVHHPESQWREVCKQTVGLYHRQVGVRVQRANQVMGYLRRWGVVVTEKAFAAVAERAALRARVVGSGVGLPLGIRESDLACTNLDLLWEAYDAAAGVEKRLRRQVVHLGRDQEQVTRWQELPGIGPIRALTLLVYLDVPGRFKSKQALWKYLGIGLVREHSGTGHTRVHVERGANRVLKNVILGAALSTLRQGNNPFAQQHTKWLAAGISPRNARRNVARSLAAVAWGMWKSGGSYDPDRVGVAAGAG